MHNHHPKIAQRADRRWVVECAQCRNDIDSTVPIGIGCRSRTGRRRSGSGTTTRPDGCGPPPRSAD